MSIFSSSSTAIFGLFAGISLLGATGCVAEVETRPAYVTYQGAAYSRPVYVEEEEPVTYVEAAPVVEIETYPSVVYAGRPVYWVDGRWYYHGPRGWAYYRSEPPRLVTHRVEFERRYPGGFHGGIHGEAHVGVHVGAEGRVGGRAEPVREAPVVHRDVAVAHPTVHASASVGARATVKPSPRSSSNKHR